ncbi:MAG: LLM class F420-dependent oxidoreductase [Candidatus Kariarchaeaceae archaeon]|jgi:F420-dependent oxidoreductase-like protein
MKLGIQIPNFSFPSGEKNLRKDLKDIVQLVDKSDFYSLWVMDHYYQIQNLFGLEYTEPMMEGYSLLNYFAGLTENVKLGTLVTGVHYREPAFLVKQATTLDVVSGGRGYFGVGAGWYKEESEAYGFHFGTFKERFEKLEEALQITKKMWSDESGPFEGKHYQLKDVHNSPQPINGKMPIMIGGMGEKKTLRMVAQYADTTNLFGRAGLEGLKHKLDVLKKHCENLNRDYNEIEKTTLNTFHLAPEKDTIEGLIKELKEFSEIGISHAIINLPNIHELAPLERVRDEVLPAIADF